MDDRIPWYRSLSAPSQVLLMIFLGLCLFFGMGLFRQLREYMANRVVYQQSLERLEALEDRRAYLQGIAQDIDRHKEELARERMAVRPGDVVIQIEPTTAESESVQRAATPEHVPIWVQWRSLFFPDD
jgi:hypothetical protein